MAESSPIPAPVNEPWYADGLRFACTRCGNCCSGAPGHVWVGASEIAAIAASLGMPAEEFERRHTRKDGARRSLLERPGGDCEFLLRDPDGRTRCAVHAVRPIQCRTWPFWSSNLHAPRTWTNTGRGCPGINQGAHHPLPVILAALRENALANLPL